MATSIKSKALIKPVHVPRTVPSLTNGTITKHKKRTTDEVQAHHQKKKRQYDTLLKCKTITALMVMEEKKHPIPTFRGTDAPTTLQNILPNYVFTDTKESIILRDSFRTLFGDKHYKFRLSTALNMSSSGTGIVNSVISNSVLASQADFVSLSSVFNEFFVVQFMVRWMPVSRYQYPLGGTSTLSIANLPIGKADLQHGQNAYTSLSAMADNFAVGYHSTGDPFTERWINVEDPNKETTITSLTAPTQSWCTQNNVSNYQGTLQFLSQAAPPALPISQVLGTFMVHWDVLFRCRA